MASREVYCRFLDLSGELRNRIYEASASKSVGERCCMLPGLALAQTCRQLRTEYLPICRKAPITINWCDVSHYLDAFYPSIAGQVQNIDQAPASMIIIADKYIKNNRNMSIDLLVLIKIRLAHTSFVCHFVRSGDEPEKETEERESLTLERDSKVLQALIHHDDEQWLRDISTGKAICARITPIGTYREPLLGVHVFRDGNTQSLPDTGHYEREAGYLIYLREVNLVDALCDENGDERIWARVFCVKAKG